MPHGQSLLANNTGRYFTSQQSANVSQPDNVRQ